VRDTWRGLASQAKRKTDFRLRLSVIVISEEPSDGRPGGDRVATGWRPGGERWVGGAERGEGERGRNGEPKAYFLLQPFPPSNAHPLTEFDFNSGYRSSRECESLVKRKRSRKWCIGLGSPVDLRLLGIKVTGRARGESILSTAHPLSLSYLSISLSPSRAIYEADSKFMSSLWRTANVDSAKVALSNAKT
jgi:hypothetical protein